ncbi:unnamed protein product [Lupinus luteus]|uniref:Uncharacterized protein n=1 Tax=Lupinus luteus TaxID=3873 RepID=A0AAV1VZP3_LUPLU
MTKLFKKNIYSFLSTNTTIDTTTTSSVVVDDYNLQLQHTHQLILGLGLINATRVANKHMNVLESTTLEPNKNPSISKRIGFNDDIGGKVDGFMSCTESICSESSGERHQTDQQQHPSLFPQHDSCVDNNDYNKKDEDNDDCDLWQRKTMMKAEGRGELRKMKSFPWPLSWLNRNGKASFVLRPERKMED